MLYKLAARCRGESDPDATDTPKSEVPHIHATPPQPTATDDGFRPAKLFSIDRVFRNETLDATHLAEFHQVEGVVADKNLTLADLIGEFSERSVALNRELILGIWSVCWQHRFYACFLRKAWTRKNPLQTRL
jgi:phenylalanyl-tRNA synthetase alpha subunit